MRALVAFRLRAAVSGRSLLAPLVAFAVLELGGVASGGASLAQAVVSSLVVGLPVLAWVARQVLDSEPDEQLRLSSLAVGGAGRSAVAHLVAALAVVVPLALVGTVASALHVNRPANPEPPPLLTPGSVVACLALTLGGALAALAVGAVASRAVAGAQGASVVVLVLAPVLTAVAGARPGWQSWVMPRLDDAARAADRGHLAGSAPGIVVQIVLWSVVLLAGRVALRRP